MRSPAVSAFPVPHERRPALAAAVAAGAATLTVAGATLLSWRAGEGRAAFALIGSIAALGVACAALGGYLVWLRRTVNARMTSLLRPYLVPATPPLEALQHSVAVVA